jgi:hypothetical protein
MPQRAGMLNVIVLTTGLTGSSVLAGLLARAGLWAGDATVKKEYDTFENLELTNLNKQLLKDAGCPIDYATEFSWRALHLASAASNRIDLNPYRNFVLRLRAQTPWILKDPRLWLTIRFWQQILEFDDVRFVWLTRECLQGWISATTRRIVMSYEYYRQHEGQVNASIEAFLELNGLPYTRLSFEQLLLAPGPTLDQLNKFLDLNLTLADLKSVYNRPLYRKSRGLRDFLVASAIYCKNYFQRVELGPSRSEQPEDISGRVNPAD